MAYPFVSTPDGGEFTHPFRFPIEDELLKVGFVTPERRTEIEFVASLGVSPRWVRGVGVTPPNTYIDSVIDNESPVIET